MSPSDLARLIDAHAAPLVLSARQWCTEPEDVVQEAFIKLARQSREPDDTVAWLYRVVRNGAIDAAKLARRRKRREAASAGPSRWFVEPDVDGLDARTAVHALEQLSDQEREVIVARHWGGLSFEQIGSVVGCSASTAFRRYTAGVEALREFYVRIIPRTPEQIHAASWRVESRRADVCGRQELCAAQSVLEGGCIPACRNAVPFARPALAVIALVAAGS
jgi:RNA polymerase sigma-70 factor (ECF subfamily)